METPPPISGSQEVSPTQSPTVQQISYAMPTTDARHESEQVTRGDVACIAVRLIGVYAFLQAFPALMTALVYMLRGRVELPYLMAYFLVPAILGAAGIFLFTRAPRFGRRLLPHIASADLEEAGGPTQLHAMAFSIVGLLLFVWSAPTLVWLIFALLGIEDPRTVQRTLAARITDNVQPLIVYGVEAALGAWLFLGSKGLAAWWGRLRHPEFRGPDASQSEDASRSGDDTARID